MLRASTIRTAVRYTALGIGGVTVAGGTAGAIYINSDRGVGLKRELKFWKVITPVVVDYWWNAASSSPKIKYQKWKNGSQEEEEEDIELKEDTMIAPRQEEKNDKLEELHQRNAPRIFDVMLNLGGLYVKLGQVLSVTALPIPEEYRVLFRQLQSNVPGHEEFETVVKPTLEKEFGRPLEEIFDSVDEIPCGAASIGQAHKAKLKETGEDVIIKVQYPDAHWQVPADIHCVGDFLNLCVWFGLVDESSARMSYDEFARQFMTELDYENERANLEQVYESSLDPNAPYIQRGVIIPKVYPELCTKLIVTMKFLPGPKFEEEARRQLEMLGFNTKSDVRSMIKTSGGSTEPNGKELESVAKSPPTRNSWAAALPGLISRVVGVDSIFFVARIARQMLLWSASAAAATVWAASYLSIVPESWESWAEAHSKSQRLNLRLNWTEEAVEALFDVHGYQILNQGLFNADPHPGNILIVHDEKSPSTEPQLGLIDYGQCKRLSPLDRVKIAKLILSVANEDSDDTVAAHFRDLGIQTKNDSTWFLAAFARLMFGPFQPEHLEHSWHKKLHEEDNVVYFPNELSMVYRTSLLLRGLAMSLQQNIAVGKLWRHHAERTINQNES